MEDIEKRSEEEIKEITDLILDHMMNPKNYGKIEDADCVGVGFDKETGELATIYMNITNDTIEEIKWNTNGCSDTVIAGSLFSEMIIKAPISIARDAADKLKLKISNASPQQQACTYLIIKAFDAALLHYEKKILGEHRGEFEKLELDISCEAIGNRSEEEKK